MQKIVNTCGCGKSYTLAEFRELNWVGNMKVEDGQEPTCVELRNCPCHSTIAIGFDQNGDLYEEAIT